MNDDLYPGWDYLTQTQLGAFFGVSGHVTGRWLTELGLRVANLPSQKAREADMARLYRPDTGQAPFWTWEKDRTIRVFEAAGHQRSRLRSTPNPLVTDTRLHGPFTTRGGGEDGDIYEVVDANGLVGVWSRGEKDAARIAKLMNYAHEKGGVWP